MKRRGFTLLEVMLAVTILGIVLTTVYGVLSRVLWAKARAEQNADVYATGRELVLRLADEIEGALPPTASATGSIQFVGIDAADKVPTDALAFVAVLRRQYGTGQARGGRALISYSLDAMGDTPGLYAIRRQEEMLTESAPTTAEDGSDADSGGPGAAAEVPETSEASNVIAGYMADRIAALSLKYLDPETGEFVEKWDTTEEQQPGRPPRGLPAAVQISVFLADETGGVHEFTTYVDLPLVNVSPTPPAGGGALDPTQSQGQP